MERYTVWIPALDPKVNSIHKMFEKPRLPRIGESIVLEGGGENLQMLHCTVADVAHFLESKDDHVDVEVEPVSAEDIARVKSWGGWAE